MAILCTPEIIYHSTEESLTNHIRLEIAQRSKTALLSGAILASLPTWLIAFIKDHPPAMLKKFFHHRVMARAVSAQLLQLKREKEKLGEEGDVNLFNAIGMFERTCVHCRVASAVLIHSILQLS